MLKIVIRLMAQISVVLFCLTTVTVADSLKIKINLGEGAINHDFAYFNTRSSCVKEYDIKPLFCFGIWKWKEGGGKTDDYAAWIDESDLSEGLITLKDREGIDDSRRLEIPVYGSVATEGMQKFFDLKICENFLPPLSLHSSGREVLFNSSDVNSDSFLKFKHCRDTQIDKSNYPSDRIEGMGGVPNTSHEAIRKAYSQLVKMTKERKELVGYMEDEKAKVGLVLFFDLPKEACKVSDKVPEALLRSTEYCHAFFAEGSGGGNDDTVPVEPDVSVKTAQQIQILDSDYNRIAGFDSETPKLMFLYDTHGNLCVANHIYHPPDHDPIFTRAKNVIIPTKLIEGVESILSVCGPEKPVSVQLEVEQGNADFSKILLSVSVKEVEIPVAQAESSLVVLEAPDYGVGSGGKVIQVEGEYYFKFIINSVYTLFKINKVIASIGEQKLNEFEFSDLEDAGGNGRNGGITLSLAISNFDIPLSKVKFKPEDTVAHRAFRNRCQLQATLQGKTLELKTPPQSGFLQFYDENGLSELRVSQGDTITLTPLDTAKCAGFKQDVEITSEFIHASQASLTLQSPPAAKEATLVVGIVSNQAAADYMNSTASAGEDYKNTDIAKLIHSVMNETVINTGDHFQKAALVTVYSSGLRYYYPSEIKKPILHKDPKNFSEDMKDSQENLGFSDALELIRQYNNSTQTEIILFGFDDADNACPNSAREIPWPRNLSKYHYSKITFISLNTTISQVTKEASFRLCDNTTEYANDDRVKHYIVSTKQYLSNAGAAVKDLKSLTEALINDFEK